MTDGPVRSLAGPVRGGWRLLRVGVLTGTSLALASAGHLAGGGEPPAPGVLVIAGLLLGLLAITLTARQLRLPVLLAVLGAQQLVLHHVFAAASDVVVVGCADAHAGLHGAAAAAVPGCSPLGSGLTGLAAQQTGSPSWPMLAAHAVATLLTAWLYARGEARLWALALRAIAAADVASGDWPQSPGRPLLPVLATIVLAAACQAEAAPRGPPRAFAVA